MRYDRKSILFLIGVVGVFILLRFPSLFEPLWYADEGIYQVISRAINSGKLLYVDIWDNKPPLLYFLYSFVSGDLFGIKLMSLFFGMFSVVALYIFSSSIFKSKYSILISTGVFAVFFGLPYLEGNIANAENFMLLPIIIAIYFAYSFTKKEKRWRLSLAGIFLSIASVIKVVAVFEFIAILIFLFIVTKPSKGAVWYFKTFINLFIPFSLFQIAFALFYISKNEFVTYLNSVFFQNIGYVGVHNDFILPMGFVVIKTAILFVIVLVIIRFRERIDRKSILIFLLLAFSTYSAMFSDRPYIHYVLVLLPSFSLLCGLFSEYAKNRLAIGLIGIGILLIIGLQFDPYKNTVGYYQNFLQYISNKKEIKDYHNFFDGNLTNYYAIASYIRTNSAKDDRIFLWSDSPQIYILSEKSPIGKYVVAYHITFLEGGMKQTIDDIEKFKPRYIVQTVSTPFDHDMLSYYKIKYIIGESFIYERSI